MASVRLPSDVAEIDPHNKEEVCIVGTAGQKITHLGNDLTSIYHPDLEKLILRSQVITKVEGLKNFRNLKLLELYDNAVTSLDGCLDEGDEGKPGSTLTVLDMSYNSIRNMSPVACCPNLTELYLAQNKLKVMKGLKNLCNLRKLDLGANRIRIMEEEELSGLVNLEELWLGKNKIENIFGIEKLAKLRKLDVQANRLTVVENLTAQKDTLEELYLSHNNIGDRGASQPSGISVSFTKLTTLDLSRNRINTTALFAHLTTLEDLWLSGNKIASFDDVEPISQLPHLQSIYLEYNPVASEFDYRLRLASMNNELLQIDANMIGGRAGAATYEAPSSGEGKTLEMLNRQRQEMAIDRAKEEQKAKKIEASVGGDLIIDDDNEDSE